MSERARCVRCGHTVNLAGQCPNCMAERPETMQTRLPPVDGGRDDCLPQAGRRHPGHCPASERPESERANPYLDPAPKNPYTLAGVVGELDEVARRLKDFPASESKDDDLRKAVIHAAITVKGCADEWEHQREHRLPNVCTRSPEKHKLLFFGPSVCDDRTKKDMKRTGTLPESKMDDRINHLMREGWRVVFRHYAPSFHVEQWRVILEKP